MSILKDRIRPLDPSSNQVFLEPDREAEAEGPTPEPFAHPPPRTSSTPEEIITLDDDIRDALRPPVPAGRTEFELESRGDITSAHETAPSGQLHAVTRDAEGHGTGK